MKKVIITENQMERFRSILYREFDKKLSPTFGWDDFEKQMKENEDFLSDDLKSPFVSGEIVIDTYGDEDDEDYTPFYYYYSCLYFEKNNKKDFECPCLMLQEYDYDFFDNRFPSELWKSFLIDWWNSHCDYPVKAVYEHWDLFPRY
jgi:hypothetical protein